jgi:hypothetical protein
VRVRFVVGSIVVHVVALVVLLRAPRHPRDVGVTAPAATMAAPAERIVETELLFDVIALGPPATGECCSAAAAPRAAATRSRARSTGTAWDQLEISEERSGGGDGIRDDGDARAGRGDGLGTGIGFGAGGGIRAAERVPDPPRVVPPPPSRARPAKLIYPVRDREVDDEGNLFIARVTVDPDGDVVGAHMLKTRPGVTGDQASSAIWTFRYLPALDERGTPIRSTFDQPFQIR